MWISCSGCPLLPFWQVFSQVVPYLANGFVPFHGYTITATPELSSPLRQSEFNVRNSRLNLICRVSFNMPTELKMPYEFPSEARGQKLHTLHMKRYLQQYKRQYRTSGLLSTSELAVSLSCAVKKKTSSLVEMFKNANGSVPARSDVTGKWTTNPGPRHKCSTGENCLRLYNRPFLDYQAYVPKNFPPCSSSKKVKTVRCVKMHAAFSRTLFVLQKGVPPPPLHQPVLSKGS